MLHFSFLKINWHALKNSVSNNQAKKTPKTKQTLFVIASPFFDVSQNCHKLEITSKQGIKRRSHEIQLPLFPKKQLQSLQVQRRQEQNQN